MRKIVLLILTFIFFPLISHALMLREADEIDIGITGGYGFPQLGFWSSEFAGTHMNKTSKEYAIGFMMNAFVLDDLSISSELLYTFNTLTLQKNAQESYRWKGYFVDLNVLVQKYWFDFLYFGGGLYLRIPFHNFVSNAPNLVGETQTSIGALLELGVDMKLADHFGLKIAARSHIPFNSYLSISKNHYSLWTFPINFIFSLDWVI